MNMRFWEKITEEVAEARRKEGIRQNTLRKIASMEDSLKVSGWKNFCHSLVPLLFFLAAIVFAVSAAQIFFGVTESIPSVGVGTVVSSPSTTTAPAVTPVPMGNQHGVENKYAKALIKWIAGFGDLWHVAAYLLAAVVAASIGYVKTLHKNYRVMVKKKELQELLSLHTKLLNAQAAQEKELETAIADLEKEKARCLLAEAKLRDEIKKITHELPGRTVEAIICHVNEERRKRQDGLPPEVEEDRRTNQLELPPPEEEEGAENSDQQQEAEVSSSQEKLQPKAVDTLDSLAEILPVKVQEPQPLEGQKKNWWGRYLEWERRILRVK